jgi:hypothetical protein
MTDMKKKMEDVNEKMEDVKEDIDQQTITTSTTAPAEPTRRYERITRMCGHNGAFYTYDGRKERYYDEYGDEW